MSSELELLRQQVTNLKIENTKLKQIIEEIANLRIENTKLKQIIKQNRTTNIASQSPVSSVLSVTPQMPTLSINSHNNTDSVNLEQTQSTIIANAMELHSSHEVNSNVSERIVSRNEKSNTSNSDIHQESETSTSPIPAKTISSEEKEVVDFLDLKEKERISNLMRARNREKKLLQNNKISHNQDLSSDNNSSEQSNSSCIIKTVTVETEDSIVARNNELTSSEIKISYNQKVEQGLISKLLEFIAEGSHKVARSNDTMIPQNLYSISGKQIFNLFKKNMTYVGDLTIGTTPYLAHLFNKAEKTSRKEKIQWYYYSEEYEKKVKTISLENNISDQMARTQIYDEMSEKILTPEFLEWQAELIDVLMDKICSKLYKRYKNETGLDPWMDSKLSESFEKKTLFVLQ
ncbi:5074_t:CDS:2, partial [Diversispora eburnea]